MKTLYCSLFLIYLVFIIPSQSKDPWVTLSTFNHRSYGKSQGIQIDNTSSIYIQGFISGGDYGGNNRLITNISRDGGKSWINGDEYSALKRGSFEMGGLCLHPSGALFTYVTGSALEETGWWTYFVIRRSIDGGKSWEIVEYMENVHPFNSDLGIASDGTIYFSILEIKNDMRYLIVKRSIDVGVTWDYVENFTRPSNISYIEFGSMVVCPDGSIYYIVFARHVDDFVNGYHIVRASYDMGKSWETVDYIEDNVGIHVVEPRIRYNQKTETLIYTYKITSGQIAFRKGTNNGKTWNNVGLVNGRISLNFAIRPHDGTIFLLVNEDLGWNILRSDNEGKDWIISDEFYSNEFVITIPYSITFDRSGNVYVLGNVKQRYEDNVEWVLRKLEG